MSGFFEGSLKVDFARTTHSLAAVAIDVALIEIDLSSRSERSFGERVWSVTSLLNRYWEHC